MVTETEILGCAAGYEYPLNMTSTAKKLMKQININLNGKEPHVGSHLILQTLLKNLAQDYGTVLDNKLKREGVSACKNMPKFGTDVQVHMPKDETVKHLNISQRYISGVFVGTHEKDERVFLVWSNFFRPGEKMQLILTDTLKTSTKFGYMRVAEIKIMEAKCDLTPLVFGKERFPPEYNNLKVGPVMNSSGIAGEILPVDDTPRIAQVAVAEGIRATFMEHVQISKNRKWKKHFLHIEM